MPTNFRAAIAAAILGSGLLLGRFAGLPSHAPRWELFAQAYRDAVTVTRAEFRAGNGELRVRAESTSATSTLRVYDRFGNLLGTLQRQDATRHEADLDVAANPMVITVRSSEGGEATVLVTGDDPPTVTPAYTPGVTPVTPTWTPGVTPGTATGTPMDTPTAPTAGPTTSATAPGTVTATRTPNGSETHTPSIPSPQPLGHGIYLPLLLKSQGLGR